MNWLSFLNTKQVILVILLVVSPLRSLAIDIYITTSVINVRTGPGTEYEVSFTLQKGKEVEVLSKIDSWYKIKHMSKTGYAHVNNLRFSRTLSSVSLEKPQQVVSFLLVAAYSCLALVVGFIVFVKIQNRRLLKTVTSLDRGTKTERDLVLRLLKFGISAQNIFHDLYLEKGKKDYAQIDLVVLTNVGIVVFEVKSYSGWIFGKGHDDQWTQVLAYGKQKYRFYNPIKQNSKHIVELRKQVAPFSGVPFYSCIVFFGNCVLKEINFLPMVGVVTDH